MPATRLLLNRILAIAVSIAGIVAAIAGIAHAWAMPTASLAQHLSIITVFGTSLLVSGIALLIAWRAGDHPPNVAMALALAFVFGGDAISFGLQRLNLQGALAQMPSLLLFVLGAGFYIRASQQFPRELTAGDIAASPTVWGKFAPLRHTLKFLLHAPAVWGIVIVVCGTVAWFDNVHAQDALQVIIVAIGIVYFYITYRGGDAEAKRKVLWFFEAAVVTLAISMIVVALRAALVGSDAPTLRAVLALVVNIASALAMVTCFAAAVFYAGAISPALIVRKTLVYAVTVAVLLFVFAAVEIFIVESLVHALHVTDRFASALLGATFGLGFHPLKHRIEHFLKRFAPAAA
jgi:hypothetical protein